jgi:hypothetical protein
MPKGEVNVFVEGYPMVNGKPLNEIALKYAAMKEPPPGLPELTFSFVRDSVRQLILDLTTGWIKWAGGEKNPRLLLTDDTFITWAMLEVMLDYNMNEKGSVQIALERGISRERVASLNRMALERMYEYLSVRKPLLILRKYDNKDKVIRRKGPGVTRDSRAKVLKRLSQGGPGRGHKGKHLPIQ